MRKRKRRTKQAKHHTENPNWDVKAEAELPATPDDPEHPEWVQMTSAVVGVEERADGSVVEHRKKFLRKRVPKVVEKAWHWAGRFASVSLALLGATILLGGIVAGVHLARSRSDKLTPQDTGPEFPQPYFTSMDASTEAAQVARGFLEADGVDAKLHFVRFPEKVRPLMEKWYQTHDAGPVSTVRDDMSSILSKSLYINDMHLIVVTLQLLPSQKYAFLVVEWTDNGGKVDWETSVGWQPVPLDEMKQRRPVTPVPYRVHVAMADYYNGPFRDNEKWLCCELTYPGHPDFHLLGYVDRRSVPGRRLEDRLSTETVSMILSLGFPEEKSEDDQVIIHGIVSEEWFLKDGPAVPAR